MGRHLTGPDARTHFRLCWALGWSITGVLIGTSSWQPPSNTGVEVSGAEHELPATLALAILFVGTATAMGITAYASMSKFAQAHSVRARFAAIWAILAFSAVAANVYLFLYPGPDWLYRAETIRTAGPLSMTSVRAQNPWLVDLVITLPLTGLVGGLSSAILLRTSWLRAVGMVVGWLLAFGVATFVGWFGMYLIKGGIVGLFQSFGLGAPLGKVVGSAATGFLTGYLTAGIGLIATEKAFLAR